MLPILGPIEYNQIHQSPNFPKKSHNEINLSKEIIIVSNIRYIEPISTTCLILYTLILLLLCILPILALNIYLRQAFVTFHQVQVYI